MSRGACRVAIVELLPKGPRSFDSQIILNEVRQVWPTSDEAWAILSRYPRVWPSSYRLVLVIREKHDPADAAKRWFREIKRDDAQPFEPGDDQLVMTG